MKRILFALAVLLAVGAVLLPQGARSQGPGQPGKGLAPGYGPGDQGATLKQPWLETSPTGATKSGPSTTAPAFLQKLIGTSGTAYGPATTPPRSLLPNEKAAINNDILVTPELGPWMILLISYSGEDGPLRARHMVSQLRTVFKLPAYVFNYGAEEKRKELERVTALIEKQKGDLLKSDLTADRPIRVRHVKIDEHFGVLLGGFPTMEAAATARDQLRNRKDLRDANPAIFKFQKEGDLLDVKFVMSEQDAPGKQDGQLAYVNPFVHGIVVHNPTIKVERPAEAVKLDVAVLKRMNSQEEFSLLKCPKNFTLVIKQFNLATFTAPRSDPAPGGSFLDSIGFGKKSSEGIDHAYDDAHRFAEALRKGKLDAYVLHMKHCSLVTVGGYDSVDDPNLRAMQERLETRLFPALETLQMMAKAMPMPIPR
jgi:hypothetical protein